MPISFPCPACNRRIHVSRKHAGKTGKCPKCEQALRVPSAQQIAELARDVEVSESTEDQLPTDSGEVFAAELAELEQEKLDLAFERLEFERAKLASAQAQAERSRPVEEASEPEEGPRRQPRVRRGPRPSERLSAVQSRSAAGAGCLSFLLPGAGLFYAGSAVGGLAVMVLTALILVGTIAGSSKDREFLVPLGSLVYMAQAVVAVGAAADTHRR